MRKILDDDMSAELILGNILAKENRFFMTNSWLYSTQLRVLDFQVLYGILFRFIDNWTHVHIITILIMKISVALLIYLLCKEIGHKNISLLLITAYFLPGCYDTIEYYYIGLWYEVYILYTLIIMLFLVKYLKFNKKIFLFISCLLSYVFCLEGFRLIAIIIVPIFMSSFIMWIIKKKDNNKLLIASLLLSIFGCFGYLTSKYLLTIYNSMTIDVGNVTFVFDDLINRILNFFDHVVYSIGGENFIIGLIVFILSIVFALKEIISNKDNYISYFALFYLCLLLVIFASYSFTNIGSSTRYILQFSIFSGPIIIFGISLFSNRKYIYLLLCLCVYCALCSYSLFNKYDNSTELEYISSQLVEDGYYNGYSTYWSSNILTELSNGNIEVWTWSDMYTVNDSFKDIDRTHKVSQLKSHITTTPKGKVFILLSNYQNSQLLDLTWNFEEKDVLFRTNNYVVYGFESYKALKQIIQIG